MKKKYWDIASGAGILILAAALFYGSTTVKTLDVSRFGSGFFPAIVAGLLTILGVVILVGGIRKARATEEKEAGTKGRSWGVAATFGLMALYALLLPSVGFLIMTALYLLAQINILAPKEKKNQLLFVIISVVSSVVIYFTFVKVFQLMLPAGILG